jgi:predicted RNA-binding protein YlqC (UPF0109 family)
MKQILIDMAKAIVDNPDAVTVTEREEENVIYLSLSVASEDMGKVIGKQGRIAKALRCVMKAAANRDNKKVIVDII